MIIGGVRAGFPGPQHHRQWLTGATGAVIDERQQRVKPETPLVLWEANSFSECAVTNEASTSIGNGSCSVFP